MSVSILIIIEMFIFIGSDFAVRDSHKQSKRREQSNIIPAMYVIKYINSPHSGLFPIRNHLSAACILNKYSPRLRMRVSVCVSDVCVSLVEWIKAKDPNLIALTHKNSVFFILVLLICVFLFYFVWKKRNGRMVTSLNCLRTFRIPRLGLFAGMRYRKCADAQ